MGFGGIGTWQLLILLAIAAVVFGTGRIKHLGGDLGNAIKGFRQAMRTDDDAPARHDEARPPHGDDASSTPSGGTARIGVAERTTAESAPQNTSARQG